MNTFNSLTNWKLQFLKQASPKDPGHFPFIVLGNKADKEDRIVTEEAAKIWCERNGNLLYFETSAKNETNVITAFKASAAISLKNKKLMETPFKENVETSQKLTIDKTHKKGCC